MMVTIILNSYDHYSSENQLDFREVSEVFRASLLYDMFVSDVDWFLITLIMKERRFKCSGLFIDSFMQEYCRRWFIKNYYLKYFFP
jgi:hypothetical protein